MAQILRKNNPNQKMKFTAAALLTAILLHSAWAEMLPSMVMLIAFVPLLWVAKISAEQKLPARSLALYIYLSFTIWNILSFWWGFKVSILAVTAPIFINATLMTVVFGLSYVARMRLGENFGYAALLFFWLAFEHIHSFWFMAFPWLNLGNGLGFDTWLIQWYEFTGVGGGSFWILLSNIVLFRLLFGSKKYPQHINILRYIIVTIIIVFPIVLSLSMKTTNETDRQYIKTNILQTNINPYTEKFDTTKIRQQFIDLIELAKRQPVTDSISVFYAPETAIVDKLSVKNIDSSWYAKKINEFLVERPNTFFIVGAFTRQSINKEENKNQLYNSVLLFQNNAPVQVYNKNLLVPGTEKPFFDILPKSISKPEEISHRLCAGKRRKAFNTKHFTVAPIVCWESIFGEFSARFSAKTDWLTVLTNDGWWTSNSGRRQQLQYSRIRAIEARRFVVRCSNTGLSAIIAPDGSLLAVAPPNQTAILSARIEKSSIKTWYSYYGDFIGRIATFFSVFLLLYIFVAKFKKHTFTKLL